MLRANFYEGVECTEGDMQSQPLVEEASNFAIRRKRPKLPSGIVTASVADFCRSNEVSICFQVDTSSTSV
jgi:hypothetical protein